MQETSSINPEISAEDMMKPILENEAESGRKSWGSKGIELNPVDYVPAFMGNRTMSDRFSFRLHPVKANMRIPISRALTFTGVYVGEDFIPGNIFLNGVLSEYIDSTIQGNFVLNGKPIKTVEEMLKHDAILGELVSELATALIKRAALDEGDKKNLDKQRSSLFANTD